MFTSLPIRQRPQPQVPRAALQPKASPNKVFIRSELWRTWSQDAPENVVSPVSPLSPVENVPLVGFLDFENSDQEEDSPSQNQTTCEKPNLSLEELADLREARQSDNDFPGAVENPADLGRKTEKDQVEPSSPVSSVSSISSDPDEASKSSDSDETLKGADKGAQPGTIHAHDWNQSYVKPSALWSPALLHLPKAYFYGRAPLCKRDCSPPAEVDEARRLQAEVDKVSRLQAEVDEISRLQAEIKQLEEELNEATLKSEEEHQNTAYNNDETF